MPEIDRLNEIRPGFRPFRALRRDPRLRGQRTVKNFRRDTACPARGNRQLPEPGKTVSTRYLRAAQAYMLISMPTGTSTIFGVFQLIKVLPRSVLARCPCRIKTRLAPSIAQALKIARCKDLHACDARHFPLGQAYFALGQNARSGGSTQQRRSATHHRFSFAP